MAEFASNGKANAALATGISGAVGTGVWLLSNLFNGGCFMGRNMNNCCNEDHLINRYELQKEQKITSLETENALLKSNIYTDQKSIELYKYVDSKFNTLEQAISQQAVYNATINATIRCIQGQVAQLQSLTKIVIPGTNVCPESMPRYNAFVVPTNPTPPAAAAA